MRRLLFLFLFLSITGFSYALNYPSDIGTERLFNSIYDSTNKSIKVSPDVTTVYKVTQDSVSRLRVVISQDAVSKLNAKVTLDSAIPVGRTLLTGRIQVSDDTQRYQLSASTLELSGVLVQSLSGDRVFIGGSLVTKDSGMILYQSQDALFIPIDQLSDLYISSTTKGAEVSYFGITR